MTGADWIGSGGVFLLLVAYFANLTGRIDRGSTVYHAMNALGAGSACFASYLIGFLPFVVLEGTWTLVSVAALAGLASERQE